MAEAKKHTVKVKKADTIFDGEGGFYPVGKVVECPDAETAKALKDKGFAE